MPLAKAGTNTPALQLLDASAPSTPASGYGKVYYASDRLMWIDDSGNSHDVVHGAATPLCLRKVQLPIITGGGTSNVEAFNDAPSINFDADGETAYVSFGVPEGWDQASDMTHVLMVSNEIAETDGDDVSFTGQARGYADGDTMSAAGQAIAYTLNLTGGTEAINVINRVEGTIDYNHGTYPIAEDDAVIIELAVNLGGGGECTGPLHIVAHWIEYKSSVVGTADPDV